MPQSSKQLHLCIGNCIFFQCSFTGSDCPHSSAKFFNKVPGTIHCYYQPNNKNVLVARKHQSRLVFNLLFYIGIISMVTGILFLSWVRHTRVKKQMKQEKQTEKEENQTENKDERSDQNMNKNSE